LNIASSPSTAMAKSRLFSKLIQSEPEGGAEILHGTRT
jgi:hypothetical protein